VGSLLQAAADHSYVNRVARCLTKITVSVYPDYGKFLAKTVYNGNVIGNTDFSMLNVFCNSKLFNF